MSHQTVTEKAEEVEEIKSLIEQHRAIGVATLQKVRAAQLQQLRKKLEASANIRVVKNTLMRRALAECKSKPRIGDLEKHLTGSNIFLFTDLNPFKLALLLEKSRVKTTAKAGDLAAQDVIVPAGNTGLPPGPIISQFSAVGIPTRIEGGSVWVSHDTMVAKEGEVITARLASVISKLGIKPVEVGLHMKVAYDDGLIITDEQMRIDLEKVRIDLEEAHALAFWLSLNTAYPLPENIDALLKMAHQEAFRLALNSDIATRETIVELIRKAHMGMLSLSSKISA